MTVYDPLRPKHSFRVGDVKPDFFVVLSETIKNDQGKEVNFFTPIDFNDVETLAGRSAADYEYGEWD